MSKWNKIVGVDLTQINSTRKALHQAVQLVGAAPRNVLTHDPTDTSASLEWTAAIKGLQSIPISKSGDPDLRAGLSFDDFSLNIEKGNQLIASLQLEGKSTEDGLAWIKSTLKDIGVDSGKINLELPYEIEDYDYSQTLNADSEALREFTKLYSNTSILLSNIVEQWEKAYDIRCWPHHFDLATLIPVETDEKGEILKSIGVGLSPGDEGINEPYLYVNVWPNVDGLEKHQLPAGHWNKEGWSGAVLTYSELLTDNEQEKSFVGFAQAAIECILGDQ